MLKKTAQKGFTIVELLIVIVVIGILAALVLNTFSGVQQRARNTERQTDINSVATQLEAYYNDAGEGKYPTETDMTTDNFATDTFQGLDEGATRAPGVTSGDSFVAGTAANKDQYGYDAIPNGCDNVDDPCEEFILSYFEEGGAAVTKGSLNKYTAPTP